VVPAHIDKDARPANITTKPSTMKPKVRPIGACASSRFCAGLAGERTGLPGRPRSTVRAEMRSAS
jgi:hypothetical protein